VESMDGARGKRALTQTLSQRARDFRRLKPGLRTGKAAEEVFGFLGGCNGEAGFETVQGIYLLRVGERIAERIGGKRVAAPLTPPEITSRRGARSAARCGMSPASRRIRGAMFPIRWLT